MSNKQIDGKQFAQMIIGGANNLTKNVNYVDALNVFPVPDGDTGTNMNLSMTSGAKEVRNQNNEHIGKVATSLSKGLLMGARGNSGVILSQLFRGFGKHIENKEVLTTVDFAKALENGVDTAYKAVIKPIEGTILTVAKDAAKRAVAIAPKQPDFILFLEDVIKEANASLQRTPDLLPVLKEVGVVDSGGQGLVIVYEGMLAVLKGEEVVSTFNDYQEKVVVEHRNAQTSMKTEDIVYGYCTEFMVKFEDEKLAKNAFSENDFRNKLSEMGDSLLVVADEEVVKVHIHVEQPGDALTYAQNFGGLINIKIENMREQHTHILNSEEEAQSMKAPVATKEIPKKPFGIVTVSMGSGIKDLFMSLGASVVIEGGQTMNPSTEDIVKAIEEAHAEKIIILPNNSNIVMAAQQAASVCEVEAVVVPSKTVPQGLSALLAFNPSVSLEENAEEMKEALGNVKTGQVTYSVRDTQIDGIDINKDDYMGIADGKIVATDSSMVVTAKNLLEKLLDADSEIVTILQGEDAKDEDVQEIVTYIEENYGDVEVEIHNGNQPLYSYIFSIE